MNTKNTSPVICFGQQPNGFFPKRYLYAKIKTARELQKKLGGKIVFFYHDSDADYRETITVFEDAKTGEEARLNFTQENKIQKKFSPLYLKKIPHGWQAEIARKLPRFVDKKVIDIFLSSKGSTAGDFCLDTYQKLGLLDGIEVVRSSDKNFRQEAGELIEYFADVEYEGEIVRAELHDGKFRIHEGGGKYLEVPTIEKIQKWQKSAGREHRFRWMQEVIHCTHYVAGASENVYLKKEDFPDVVFVEREKIDKQNLAYF